MARRRCPGSDESAASPALVGRATEHELRAGVELGHLTCKSGRERPIVGVEAHDQVARAHRQAVVQRIHESAVPLVSENPQAFVGNSRRELLARLVGRAVIDDDQFEIGEGLAEDAVDRLADRTAAVEDGKEHRDAGVPARGSDCCDRRRGTCRRRPTPPSLETRDKAATSGLPARSLLRSQPQRSCCVTASSPDVAEARGVDGSDPFQACRRVGHRPQLRRVLVEGVLGTLKSIAVTAVRTARITVPGDERPIDARRRQPGS